MENRRMILLALIGVIVYLLYEAWQTDYAKPPSPPAQAAAATAAPGGAAGRANTDAAAPAAAGGSTSVHVHTDVVDADIALAGGELRRVELLHYPVEKKHPEQKLALLDDSDGHRFTLQSGIAGSDAPLSSSQTLFHAAQERFELAEGSDTLEVPLEYSDAGGYTVRKVFKFTRGSYQASLTQTLVNHSGHELDTWPYLRWQRTPPPAKTGGGARFANTFAGIGVYEHKPDSDRFVYKQHAFKDLDKQAYEVQQTGGWLAVLQQYFVCAIIPPQDAAATFSAKPVAGGPAGAQLYQAQYLGPETKLADGAEHSYEASLYIGPQEQDKLASIAPGFDRTLDYGLLTAVAEPLFLLMRFFHRLAGNWGWAIILLTCTVRLAFYPLSAAQYRSMAKMRKFGPRITELRERYADDRERLNKAMMDLYKKEGFNPLAGCWPLLIQMPVFFGLYQVLAKSVELRQAPFIFWMQDLSAADPWYIMPVLYGASMWVQQQLSGQTATMDPTQQKMMNVMPIALTGLFLFFPVGLVLYWLVSNTIGIAQQWVITKRLQKEGLK